jgi:hypothetical protein
MNVNKPLTWRGALLALVITPIIGWSCWKGMDAVDAWNRSSGAVASDPEGEYSRLRGQQSFYELHASAEAAGGAITGEANGVVYMDVPGPVSGYDARTLARETRERVNGTVKVRDGSGKVVATADAFGVR